VRELAAAAAAIGAAPTIAADLGADLDVEPGVGRPAVYECNP
jgi:hypothetical protein